MGAEIIFNKGHIDVHQADHYLGLDVDSLKFVKVPQIPRLFNYAR